MRKINISKIIPCSFVITIILLILQFCNIINLSWWIIFLPIYGLPVIMTILIFCIISMAFIHVTFDYIKEKYFSSKLNN